MNPDDRLTDALDLVNASEQSPADFDIEAIELQSGAGA